MRYFIVLGFLIVATIPATTSQIPDLPEIDQNAYVGLDWGTAGILYAFSHPSVVNQSKQLIEFGFNFILNNSYSIENTKILAWEKGPELKTGIYPGRKYGAVGIIESFLSLYNSTRKAIYLEVAEETFRVLMNQAVENTTQPHWGYVYHDVNSAEGISLTGLEFGASGVLDMAMKIYEITEDNYYLDSATKIGNWLVLNSKQKDREAEEFSIPWYSSVPGFADVEIFEYNRGIAGIAPVLAKLGILTGNSTFSTVAMGLGNRLISMQLKNGGWTNQNDTTFVMTNFAQGAAGIIYGLHRLGLTMKTEKFDDAISNGLDFIFSNFQKGKGFRVFENEQIFRNGLYNGNLGIFMVLLELMDRLSPTQESILTEALADYLATQLLYGEFENQIFAIMRFSPSQNDPYDISFADGLAGVLWLLLSKKETLKSLGIDTEDTIDAILYTLKFALDQDGMWKRQIQLPQRAKLFSQTTSERVILQIGVTFLALLVIVRRKYHSSIL